jgi:putative DNA primase/helicase
MLPNDRHNDIQRARDALHAIPADLPRNEWVRAGMAAHAAGLTFDDFNEWSATAANYRAPECRATFRSFKTGKGVGAGTLFAMAREHGYTDGDRTAPTPAPRVPPAKQAAPGMSAADVWSRCEAATYMHQYIVAKRAAGVPLDGLCVLPANDALRIGGESMAGALVVPAYSPDGELQSLQLIPPASKKMNLPGCPIGGALFAVGTIEPGGVAYIAEGIGQAWACWQATGAAAVVCFGAGNMSKVAAALRERDPAARLVLVPDAGKEQDAEKIARQHGCAVAYMPEGEASNFDANDLAQREGTDVLAALLQAAQTPATPPPMLKPVSVGDVLTNPAPPPLFVWDGYLPRGVVALLGAHGGAGKSTIALMLGVCAALGRPLFGVHTAQCKTLFLSLEDGAHIVRHRLAGICRHWGIDPVELDEKLHIVDGTENPELFSADGRGAGETTTTHHEVRKLVQSEGVGLVVVDNASDAYGGDEINRRQVRAFMRALVEVARLTNCAVLLLAHVDKNTSRNRKAEGGEGYSGSTAWHNSARSRLFMTRTEDGTLTLEHQKSNLSKTREPLTLDWPEGGFPQAMGASGNPLAESTQYAQGRADDDRAIKLLAIVAEFESRGQFCSPIATARNNVHAMLKSEPAYQRLKLNADGCKRIVNQCQRAGWIESVEYRTHDRKTRTRWTLTPTGRAMAGLPVVVAPCAPCAPCTDECAQSAESAGGAPCAPSCVGGVGE